MDFLQAAPEQLAKFINFVALFAQSPQSALQPLVAPDATAKPAVNGQLILFCTLSVGCGALIMTIGSALGMAEDRSWSVGVFRRIDSKALPVVVALGIIVASGVWHGITRVVGAILGRFDPDLKFDGAVENSLNAGLAFGTLYVPALSAALVAIRLAAAHSVLPWFVLLLAVLPLSVGFIVYFVLAFAAVHRIAPIRYFVLFGSTIMIAYYLSYWATTA